MAGPKSWRLAGAVAAIGWACLLGAGCQGRLMYVPADARVTRGSPGTNGYSNNSYYSNSQTQVASYGPTASPPPAGYPATSRPMARQPRSNHQLAYHQQPQGYPEASQIMPVNCPPGAPCAQNQGGYPGMIEPMPAAGPLPTEIQKVSHPPYMVEPPDILLIDAIRFVPKPPYRIEPLDQLTVQATETFPNQPIAGIYTVTPDGFLALGFNYGTVRVAGLTLEQAEAAIRAQLNRVLRNAGVSVGLAQFRGIQQVRGEHLVRPDGTISLGVYGCVHVAGLTLAQIKTVVEKHLSMYLQDPEVSIDVFAYNSKSFYVIADGAGYGQQVFKFPSTGNETVLDAIERIGGIPPTGSTRHIWVARPAPCGHPCVQVLPVDWMAITQGGATCTNYQLFPGDRIYIKSDPLIHLDYALAKIFSPIERVLGITLLGASTYQIIANGGVGGGNGGFIVGGF